jgi:hypothetical protein
VAWKYCDNYDIAPMAMKSFRKIHILRAATLLHIIIIILFKLSGVLLCNEFLSLPHNGWESHSINGVRKQLFDATICLKENRTPTYKRNGSISKVIRLE